jgi:hypothetical protein
MHRSFHLLARQDTQAHNLLLTFGDVHHQHHEVNDLYTTNNCPDEGSMPRTIYQGELEVRVVRGFQLRRDGCLAE